MEQPPVPGTIPVEFTFYDLPENCKVTVDSHSSSPAFAHEMKQDLFDLIKVGAITPKELLEHLHVPGADGMIEQLDRAAAEKAAYLAQHPEAAQEENKKKKR